MIGSGQDKTLKVQFWVRLIKMTYHLVDGGIQHQSNQSIQASTLL